MDTVTIPKKEYKRLKDAEKKWMSVAAPAPEKKFELGAFALWKSPAKKESSVVLVNRMRKKWR